MQSNFGVLGMIQQGYYATYPLLFISVVCLAIIFERIWALWGVHDYFLATNDPSAPELFSRGVRTLLHNLDRYDLGFWSLYEQSGTRLPMVASPFYHQLHIVQLRVMHRLTGEEKFAEVADRWLNYTRSHINRARALCYKIAFKLCYY